MKKGCIPYQESIDQGGSGANASRSSNKDVDAWLDRTLDTARNAADG
ncbi:hypothetical protein ACFYY8_02145 [Streptosporangium sp. NPDC001559]